MSNIQDYIDYMIIKHEILPTNFPIQIYIDRINNRLLLRIKDRKKEIATPETEY